MIKVSFICEGHPCRVRIINSLRIRMLSLVIFSVHFSDTIQGPLILTWSNLSNHMPSKGWGEITYPFPNFNDCAVEVWEWISNFVPHFLIDVITYPTYDHPSYGMYCSYGMSLMICFISRKTAYHQSGSCTSMQAWCHYALRTSQWHRRDGVSNHKTNDCLFNYLFRGRSKKTSKLRIIGLCAGN